MVGSEVKMFSVNDGSLEGNIRILHPVIYTFTYAVGSDGIVTL